MEINLNNITEIDNQNLDSFLGNKLESLGLIYNEQILNLGYASLTSQEWLFDGIRIGYSSWNFQEPSVIKWEFDAPADFITLYFNLKGFTKTFRKDQPDKKHFKFSNYQHNMLYTPENKGELKSDGFELRTFMIKIPKHTFIHKTQDSNEGLKRFSDQVLNNQSSILSEKSLFLDMAMHNAIHAIVNCRIEGSLKKIFLHAKCMELLVLQADAQKICLNPTSTYVKSDYDKELFFYAGTI